MRALRGPAESACLCSGAVIEQRASTMFSGNTGAVVAAGEGLATSAPSYGLARDVMAVVDGCAHVCGRRCRWQPLSAAATLWEWLRVVIELGGRSRSRSRHRLACSWVRAPSAASIGSMFIVRHVIQVFQDSLTQRGDLGVFHLPFGCEL